jgi:CO dehydrogenase nickel-insertion accessory protein CooC1
MNYRSDTYYHSKGSVAVKIAITGKGGVGKTTLAAGLINLFAQRGFQVYAVDADPDVSLGTTLGVPEETLAAQPPLVEMRELIKERTGAQGGFFVLNPQVDDVLDKYSIDIGNIKLLRMGGYKNAGSSCYCPENAFLNAIVNSLLLGNKDVVILDFGAGIEHLTRGTARGVDLMLIVTEPTKVSVDTAKVIQTLSSEMEISDVKVVGNKVRTEKENMYFLKIDDDDFAVKPMNCPGAMIYYNSRVHSYREFPLRIAELGLVHRHERSGVLHGLMRVRCFTQDDAHIFMLPEQITDEIIGVIDMIDYFYSTFGFTYRVELSTKPEKAMGSDEIWDTAINALKKALEVKEIPYKLNEGDGAFYGPKIDFHLQDSLGRSWQCGTIQLDFVNPESFDLTYISDDGSKKRPVMIHRVVFGSIERFLGILTEHYGGAFPIWLAPVQVKVLTVASRHTEYAAEIAHQLEKEGIRVEVDDRNERVGYKIREGEVQKVPYLLILGDQEVESQTVSVRKRSVGDQGALTLQDFMINVKEEIDQKS